MSSEAPQDETISERLARLSPEDWEQLGVRERFPQALLRLAAVAPIGEREARQQLAAELPEPTRRLLFLGFRAMLEALAELQLIDSRGGQLRLGDQLFVRLHQLDQPSPEPPKATPKQSPELQRSRIAEEASRLEQKMTRLSSHLFNTSRLERLFVTLDGLELLDAQLAQRLGLSPLELIGFLRGLEQLELVGMQGKLVQLKRQGQVIARLNGVDRLQKLEELAQLLRTGGAL